MNNTNGNAGAYVILADSVIYNTSYQTTKCLKFDYDVYVIIETDSDQIRHGEFNSTELNDLHSSDIRGIYFPFKLNKDYYHRFSFKAGKTYSIRIIAPYQTITDSNRLVGKKVYGFGYSLMKGHYSGEGMLTGLCRDNGMQFTNYAINGASVQGSTGGYNITNQITDASQTVPDFIVVDGMTNDLASSTDLGQLTDSYSSNDFDLTTYYGALENELYTLRNKYMTANIIYVIQHRMPTRNKAAQDSFVDATLKTCAKWSIPVVNIYDDGQINCYLDNMRNAYSYNNEGETSGGNGTHLTGTGYNKWYAPIIKAKMLEILA
jgi:lysophospholipase L1-like esterase